MEKVTKNKNKVSKATVLASSLRDEEGSAWLDEVERVLAKRVDILIVQDDFCRGLLETLNKINVDLRLGEKAAQHLVGQVRRT